MRWSSVVVATFTESVCPVVSAARSLLGMVLDEGWCRRPSADVWIIIIMHRPVGGGIIIEVM